MLTTGLLDFFSNEVTAKDSDHSADYLEESNSLALRTYPTTNQSVASEKDDGLARRY